MKIHIMLCYYYARVDNLNTILLLTNRPFKFFYKCSFLKRVELESVNKHSDSFWYTVAKITKIGIRLAATSTDRHTINRI